MKILGQKNSINVRKVLLTLAEIQAPYSSEDWGGDTKSTQDKAFLALNPKGLIPVLVDGDFVLTESNAICRYLATSHQRTDLLPQTPNDRAVVESWMDWQATELNNAWRPAFMGLVRKDPMFSDAQIQQASAARWNAEMALLERTIERTGMFVCGEHFTLADIVLALSTNRWLMTPIERPDMPAISAWIGRLKMRAGFSEYCWNGVP